MKALLMFNVLTQVAASMWPSALALQVRLLWQSLTLKPWVQQYRLVANFWPGLDVLGLVGW